jgi:hypothetical protein
MPSKISYPVVQSTHRVLKHSEARTDELTEELLACLAVPSTLAALIGAPSSLSFSPAVAVHPQLLLSPLGPDSAGDDLAAAFRPEDEAGRAVAAGAGAIGLGDCPDAASELLLVPADDDGREGVGVGGANLTTAGLLPAWTTAAVSLSSSLMLLREDVDMLSEEDDFLTSTNCCSRLCGGKLGFLGFSMTILYGTVALACFFFELLQLASKPD